jgi:hypothetical protein
VQAQFAPRGSRTASVVNDEQRISINENVGAGLARPMILANNGNLKNKTGTV